MIYVIIGLVAGLVVVTWRLLQSEARHRRAVEGTGVALKESEERYRTLFHYAPVGIGVSDVTGTLVAVNETLRTLGGYGPDEPLPNVAQLYHDPGVRDALIAEVRAKGVVRQREVRFRPARTGRCGRPA